MKTLLIACGNPLRGDDGAALAVVTMLRGGAGASACLIQLTPELAPDIAPYDRVLFLDADASATIPQIEPIAAAPSAPTLSHASSPVEIVHLARALFKFRGKAYICRIPARDFSPREGLSPECLSAARQTCVIIERGAFS
jgi:hydrogenase maturation protease